MQEDTNQAFSWQSAINETFSDISDHFFDYIPQLLAALLLLLLGYVVAHLARALSKKAIQALNKLFLRLSPERKAKALNISPIYAAGISRIVFWCVLLFFVAACTNLLGLQMFAGWMDGIINQLPSILTGLIIIIVGFVTGNIVLSIILNSSITANRQQNALLARIAQITIITSAIFIGVEHIGLDMHFLTGMATTIVAILLGGACLAFGLGARDMVANTIGAQYARRNCRLGECIQLAGYEGELIEIRQTCIVLEDTKEGRVLIPAKLFNQEISVIRTLTEVSETQKTDKAQVGKENT